MNERLIATYRSIRDEWRLVQASLAEFQERHSKEFYYEERCREHSSSHLRAAQFLYLNRTCFNGLYRENLKGQFNVPLGTKTQVTLLDDDFEMASNILSRADLRTGDFEAVVAEAVEGDLVFLDPPYTTAHNCNGFVKYNQKIFNECGSREYSRTLRRAWRADSSFSPLSDIRVSEFEGRNHRSTVHFLRQFKTYVAVGGDIGIYQSC